MAASIFAIVVFSALAAVVLGWAEADYAENGELTSRSTLGAWLLYFFHGDSVATAAYVGALQLSFVPETAALVAGGAVGAVGIVFFIGAAAKLSTATTGEATLATSGVFRLVRHPQNYGWGLLLLGIAIAGRSVLAVALVAMFVVFVARYTRIEEAHLEKKFGDAWRSYRDRTPAMVWLPSWRLATR